MKYKNNRTGFSISDNSVRFDFSSGIFPEESDNVYKLKLCGFVPVPCILPDDRIILPVDEGIALTAGKSYTSGELDINNIKGSFCQREGTVSMIIIERKQRFLLIALRDGINSEYSLIKENGIYSLKIICNKPCEVVYGIFGSLKEACRYYRKFKGVRFITLKEKAEKNPEIKKLIGGGIFWIWNDNYDKVMYSEKDTDISPVTGDDLLKIADELYKNGVRNAMFGLFFNGDSPASEILYKKYGYISTQYDNYNDVLNPGLLKIIPNNRAKNCDYTFRRMKDYPDGVQLQRNGKMTAAWALKGFDGKMYNQNTLCPLVASKRIKEEIPGILKEYPYYKGRFIDVYGGNISECFHKEHPVTREECLKIKNEAFGAVNNMGLIAGTEDGFEGLINNLVYTEGLHSPVYFRINDAGRNHAHIYSEEQKKHIEKYMLNPGCRIPLWQLVYHDCLLSFPYWGDSTEMSPDNINKKILFACLYGCPPLYSFMVKDFEKLKDQIIFSYKKITGIHKKTAELPMTDFEIMTDDYMIQRSVFGDKYEITVNFSEKDYDDGKIFIPSDNFVFKEI